MAAERIALEDFNKHFSGYTELSSVALGGRIVGVSDEFFAKAFHLLLVEPAPSMKGQFGPNGALFSGWETRRHNSSYDWCVIQLGTTGKLCGFDVDTANFNGNEAPEVSIYALHDPELKDPAHDDPRWTEVLPRSNLGPSSRHLFKVPATTSYNYVKIHMYPDGGIARLRAYGEVSPVHPTSDVAFDLAHVFAGGRVLAVSDQHFGVGSNLILPGRGKNMGDGWETKRSRTKGHNDWVIIQLGVAARLEQVEIDTNHFLGNFPQSCEIHAIRDTGHINWSSTPDIPEDSRWELVLPRTRLSAHRQHYFELENVEESIFTHIKVTIHPDGGMKRVRVIGRKATQDPPVSSETTMSSSALNRTRPSAPSISRASTHTSNITSIPVEPLTSEAFMPYGKVIQAYSPSSPSFSSLKITPANGGTASKFHKLALLSSSYPETSGATTGISVYRCQPLEDILAGATVLRTLERHSHTSQAFIPLGAGSGQGIENPSGRYLVVVAHNGQDDRPDMRTVKAFIATTAQGISYDAGIWHQPMTVLGKPLDLACVETQIGDGSNVDCEIRDLGSIYILVLD